MPLLPRLASMKIAVVCLLMLLVLTAWGTIYQAEHGLYAAQVRFFNSWFFLVGGFVPVPGAQAVMWVLFVNLVASMLFRVKYRVANIGNIISHAGLLVLLAGSFVTYHYATESYLPLKEMEMSNVSLDRRQWELAVWAESIDGMRKEVSTYAIGPAQAGKEIDFGEFGLKVVLKAYYRNCESVQESAPATSFKLVPRRPTSDPEDNVAGVLLNLIPTGGEAKEVGLYGAFEAPASVEAGGAKMMVALRKKRHPLPFTLKLLDVKKEDYPGTGIARNYQSDVEILGRGMDRKARIFMNNPLRDKGYTFFQSSYFVDERGKETSVFAVVENKGRLIPYIASAMIFGGMVIHFLLMLFGFGKRRGNTVTYQERKPITTRETMSTLKTVSSVLLLSLYLVLSPVSAQDVSLEGFKALPVLEGGRVKPLDTYARVTLLQMSSKSTYQGEPAVAWLARVLFTPKEAMKDPIFRINNPDVVYALGIEPQAGSRYSFALLSPAIGKLSELADKAMQVNEKKRTPLEAEILRVANNVSLYLGVMNGFLFATPHSDFRVDDPSTAKALGLPERDGPYSFLEIRSRMKAISALTSSLMVDGGHGKSPSTWTPEEMGAFQLAERFDNWSEHYRSFPIHMAPPMEKGSEMWFSPWGLVTLQNPDARTEAAVTSLQKMAEAYVAGHPEAFSAAVDAFGGFVKESGAFKERRITMEIFYNILDPFHRAKILYGFAILASLASMLFLRRWLHPVGLLLLGGGVLLQFAGLGLRIGISGQAPVTNLFETFVFVAWTVAVLGLILEFYMRKGYGLFVGAVAAFCLMLLSGKYDNDGDTIGVLVAVLNSNFWLTTHVITISLGYAGFCLAGVVGHIWLIQAALNRHDMKNMENTEKLESLDRMTYAVMAFGLIFAFIGTVLGGVWADQSWGRFWGWDPKENGALMIVLWGAILFHARPAKLIGPMGMAAGSVVGIIVVMMAWFGINLLGVGLHSYGFTSGVANSLAAYVAAEMIFLGATLFLIKRAAWLGTRLDSNPVGRA